ATWPWRSRGDRPRLKTLAVALALFIALLFASAWIPLVEARDHWRAGHTSEAIQTAERWSALHLWPGEYHQILAAAYLTAVNDAAARPHLAAIHGAWISVIDKGEVGQRLLAHGRYAAFLAYDAASREPHDSDETRLYRAAAQTVTNQTSAAAATFAA